MGVRADIVATARATVGHIIRFFSSGGSVDVMPNRQYLDFAGNCTVNDDGTGIKVTIPEVPAGSVTIGNVTLTAPGSMPTITNTGTDIHAVLNFTLPQGVAGPQGKTGPQGEKGDKGDTGETGSTGEQGPQGIQGERGPQGVQGIQGEQGPMGPAPTLVTGTTTTGAAGSQASLSLVAQGSGSYVVNATIPQGIQGVQGIQGIQGPQGEQGIQGEQGPRGETGATGATGPAGTDGFSPTATVTSTSTGATITITDKNGTTTATVTNGSTYTVPIGIVVWYAKQTGAPTGFLLCNGSAVSRTTYSTLYDVIGTTYGSGDGSTTFNLPNLIDKFIEGSATAGTTKTAGAPNIVGTIYGLYGYNEQGTGAWATANYVRARGYSVNGGGGDTFTNREFNASKYNSIYGSSTTIQPPALTLQPYIKY